jgi:formylglycine-generating enzyme required for sulfatase activity
MKCPHCGGEHPTGAGFCPTTGQPLSTGTVCPFCDQLHPESAQFCPVKGKELISSLAPQKPKQRSRLWIGLFLLLGCAGVIVGMWFGGSLLIDRPLSIPGLQEKTTNTPHQESTNESEETTYLTSTSPPTLTSTPVPTITISPVPTETQIVHTPTEENVDAVNVNDNAVIVLIPAGEFTMGSDSTTDRYFWGAEAPSHTVNLDEFYIYKTEVTNVMYTVCVEEKACPRPEANNSRSIKSYYGNPTYDNYPVIMVSWVHAVSYCKWAGGRLPTEAEWEKAARGIDSRLFPWGNDSVNGNLVNYCDRNCPNSSRDNAVNDGYADTAPIGSFPAGASPYSILDMAGNVWEWVNDFFVPEYYKISPFDNPLGPASGSRRGIRGGSWFNTIDGIRTVARSSLTPDSALDTLGFRCVIDFP